MTKSYFILLTFLVLTACKQIEQEKIYSNYKCPDGKIPSCDDCTKQSSKITYLLNKDEKSVMSKLYVDGKNTYTYTRKNCVIFNENNWDCSTEEKSPPFLTVKDFMADGMHKYYVQTINVKNATMTISTTSCAMPDK
jgi:hypothetical protein